MESKNETIQKQINRYFLMLKDQNRELDENVLCGLIQQWVFDYRMDKDLNRFNT